MLGQTIGWMIRDLIAEAERIATPSLLLSLAPANAEVIGWWRGHKPDWHAGRADDTHRISVDCAWLSQHCSRAQGVLSVYDVAPRRGWAIPFHVEQAQEGKLSQMAASGGRPLVGRKVSSLPPLKALCLSGGEPVGEWLSSAGLERTDYDRASVSANTQSPPVRNT